MSQPDIQSSDVHTPLHPHPLRLTASDADGSSSAWQCSGPCRLTFSPAANRYHCMEDCEFDLCETCKDEATKSLNKNIVEAVSHLHPHILKTNLVVKHWFCDQCKAVDKKARYRCQQCDFDLCEECKESKGTLKAFLHGTHALRPATAAEKSAMWQCAHCKKRDLWPRFICTQQTTDCDYSLCQVCVALTGDTKDLPSLHAHPVTWDPAALAPEVLAAWQCGKCLGKAPAMRYVCSHTKKPADAAAASNGAACHAQFCGPCVDRAAARTRDPAAKPGIPTLSKYAISVSTHPHPLKQAADCLRWTCQSCNVNNGPIRLKCEQAECDYSECFACSEKNRVSSLRSVAPAEVLLSNIEKVEAPTPVQELQSENASLFSNTREHGYLRPTLTWGFHRDNLTHSDYDDTPGPAHYQRTRRSVLDDSEHGSPKYKTLHKAQWNFRSTLPRQWHRSGYDPEVTIPGPGDYHPLRVAVDPKLHGTPVYAHDFHSTFSPLNAISKLNRTSSSAAALDATMASDIASVRSETSRAGPNATTSSLLTTNANNVPLSIGSPARSYTSKQDMSSTRMSKSSLPFQDISFVPIKKSGQATLTRPARRDAFLLRSKTFYVQ